MDRPCIIVNDNFNDDNRAATVNVHVDGKEDDVNDDKRLIDGRANHCAVPEGHHKNQKNLVRLPNSDA